MLERCKPSSRSRYRSADAVVARLIAASVHGRGNTFAGRAVARALAATVALSGPVA
ncbi:hypothetical protein LA76x_3618 [Lysobacter antibioticus]|uniref:Uncharacterized protein n=1 Tax=Lysobacter antibioticus TaxID=84531 RepID=A0A0S2FDW8_LYSAN|nr:hypothetical protein LA76x_3618 [Lysobacter antibioticus]